MAISLEAEALQFLQARFHRAFTLHKPMPLHKGGPDQPIAKTMTSYVAFDHAAGVKQLLLCVPALGSIGEGRSLATQLDAIKRGLEGVALGTGNDYDPHANVVFSGQLVWSPIVVLFTDVLHAATASLRADFAGVAVVEVSDARSRAILSALPRGKTSSVFISYGQPDEPMATRIDEGLREKGVKTWFFPRDATPGEKLHRVMSQGVDQHDRVLLLCSSESLIRPGVLNELERVLEREAREGGSSILLPVRLDDFVLSEWAPDRPDLAKQVRSRVIGDFTNVDSQPGRFELELGKVIAALAVTKLQLTT